MKKLVMLTAAILLVASSAMAVEYVNETFSYPDGSLVPNGGWANHSGTLGDLLVANGQAVVTHGVPSEDANIAFAPGGGDLYYAFDFSVDDLGHPYASGGGTDFEYFAHFKDDGFGFRARMDIVAPNGGGDYTVGISSIGSTADAVYPLDLMYGVTYRVIARYNQDLNIAELWIDANTPTDLSILGTDQSDPGTPITAFALRQSDSTENETIRVDNLIVGDTCADIFPDCGAVANETQSWGAVKSLFR